MNWLAQDWLWIALMASAFFHDPYGRLRHRAFRLADVPDASKPRLRLSNSSVAARQRWQ